MIVKLEQQKKALNPESQVNAEEFKALSLFKRITKTRNKAPGRMQTCRLDQMTGHLRLFLLLRLATRSRLDDILQLSLSSHFY